MNKPEIYEYLKARGVSHEITEHGAVFSMSELGSVPLPYPDRDAKNLFLLDDKKQRYYLITVMGDKRVDIKAFRRAHGTRPLNFAPPEDLMRLFGTLPGSVSPLGALCDERHEVKVFLDADFFGSSGIIGVHPNENTATVWLNSSDLKSLLEERGASVEITDIPVK